MIIRKRLAHTAVILLGMLQLSGQDPVLSHFTANSLYLNPSLAGIEGPARYYIGYRNQWPNTTATFISYHAAYDQYIESLHGGIGVKVMNDQQGGGIFNAYNVDAMYSYQFMASRKLNISGGMQAGVGQRSFNPNNLQFGDMIDPVTGNLSGLTENISGYSKFYPDFAFGASAFYQNFHGGLALFHLFNPYYSDVKSFDERISRKIVLHAGAMFSIEERRRRTEIMKLTPGVIYIQQQNKQQLAYGTDMMIQGFVLGVWTRHDLLLNYGDLIFTAGYYSDRFRLRYSYDIKLTSPTIRIPNLGAHEISLLILYEKPNRRNRQRTINYPKI